MRCTGKRIGAFLLLSAAALWSESAHGLLRCIDINPSGDSTPYALENLNGALFFNADDGVHGRELWRSDGTAAGTVMVGDINPSGDFDPIRLTNVNGTLFFTANDGVNGRELWKSNGTAAGTVMVKDISPSDAFNPQAFTDVNGTLFFMADDGVHGYEIWKSNGTAAGTVMVRDINPFAGLDPWDLTSVGGTLFFMTEDGAHGKELWRSNGTEAGTVMVRDINPSGDSSPGSLRNVNGTLFFMANDGVNGFEFWKSDGTERGTVMVMDINRGPGGSMPGWFTNVNGTIFFTAGQGGALGTALWKTNGSEVWAVMTSGISRMQYLTNVNGTLFLTADDGRHDDEGRFNVEIWKSDGTAAGTVMVRDINPSGASYPSRLTNVNGTLFFTADDGVHGRELWKSDGTAAGTVLVEDIYAGSTSSLSFYAELTLIGANLFFGADDPIRLGELWLYGPDPELSIGDVAASEGDSGTTTFVFTVSLSLAGEVAITVDYATADGTAEDEAGDGDYLAASGTLTFNPGETVAIVTVEVVGDVRYESDETFTVDLSNASGAPIADAQGLGTILNDESSLSIDDVALDEGDSGTRDWVFTVSFAGGPAASTTVDYATSDVTATAGEDYASAAGTLTFGPGPAQRTISVQVTGDTSVEEDEVFMVLLTNASSATIADAEGVGTILDDDGAPGTHSTGACAPGAGGGAELVLVVIVLACTGRRAAAELRGSPPAPA